MEQIPKDIDELHSLKGIDRIIAYSKLSKLNEQRKILIQRIRRAETQKRHKQKKRVN